MAKYPRENRLKIAKRALSRWNKILRGQQPAVEDISMIFKTLVAPHDEIEHTFAAQRNRNGTWDVVLFWAAGFGLFGRHSEDQKVKNATLEECLDYLYKVVPPYAPAGRFTHPCDLRKVAARIDFVPSNGIKGNCLAAAEQIEGLRERSLASRAVKIEKMAAEREKLVNENIVVQSRVKALKPIRLKTA
ncbi:MAG: hypothetical protein ACAH80_16350 [Alphaproteobacteria bacterium]